ncbi:polysaccharide lyase [Nibricoccus aquaticus]|uniref:polysaccharide lyase n=1 Tax=Nibricoccus aquaticus TaxID=2576891 RepID=UPI0010FD3C5E|nr:polysaccharide lyase [Nibricoccus aquaticus]
MKTLRTLTSAATVVSGVLLTGSDAFAQGYPRIDPAVQKITDERVAAEKKRSDELFAKQLPEIEAWAAKGKPYLPGAAEAGDLPQAKIPAFPGAEGGGMYSFGGRGGKVLVVTNLNDSGPGSFREACEAAGPRVVVFNVAGIIQLKNRIVIRAPYITISGATAPGDGVCIAGNTVELESHDIIIRHMRFRRGATDATERNDSIGGNPVGNVMIDHVSASWGLDENMSMYRHMYQPPEGGKELKLPTVNISIQHSIFSEALNTYHHAFGSTIGGRNSTFHHNLWASNTGRNPSVGMDGDFTFVNNVVFNYRHRTVDGGDHRSRFNIINNYFKPGPGTPDTAIAYRLLKPESERSKTVVDNFGKAYVDGNVVEGHDRVTRNNWDGGVQPDSQAAVQAVLPKIRVEEPFKHAALTIQTAREAYEEVLKNAGATLPVRDAVDERVVKMVKTGKVAKATITPESKTKAAAVRYDQKWIDEMEEMVTKGYITDPSEVGGYPKYSGKPYKDTDGDGLPDSWEKKYDLDPKNAADAVLDLNGDGYTNIEEFINGTNPEAKAKS